jgi:Domain of unknown function (DU1801)
VPRKIRPIASAEVAGVFDAYPPDIRKALLRVRNLILETAAATEGVGEIEETLKWGQPSYLTPQSGSGTTIRIDRVKSTDDAYALYVNCQTSLVATFRERYPKLRYDGKRAIVWRANDKIDAAALRHCIALALTYHLRKKEAVA